MYNIILNSAQSVTNFHRVNTQLQSDVKQVLAKDANTKDDDWYEIFDPRNPITKRRRESNKQEITEKRKAKYDLK